MADPVDLLIDEDVAAGANQQDGGLDPNNRHDVRRMIVQALRNYHRLAVEHREITFARLGGNNENESTLVLIIYTLLGMFPSRMRDLNNMNNYTYRKLYYAVQSSYPDLDFDYEYVYRAVTIICNEFRCARDSLPVETAVTGIFVITNGTTIKARIGRILSDIIENGMAINSKLLVPSISTMRQWEAIETNAKYLLILESDAQYRDLVSEGFLNFLENGVILISGGVPALTFRYFGKFFEMGGPHFPLIPIFSLLDTDGGGLNINSIIQFGPYGDSVIGNNDRYIIHTLQPIFVIHDNHRGNGHALTDWDETAFEITKKRITLAHMNDEDRAMFLNDTVVYTDVISSEALAESVYPHSSWLNIIQYLRNHDDFGVYFIA